MKKRMPLLIFSLAASVLFSAGIVAQEQTEGTIQIKKDGKVIQDTTYQFDDADEAKDAVMMMEVLSGHVEGMENVTYNYTSAHPGRSHSKAMVFISEDGEKTEIKEFHGDSLVWVSEEEGEGDIVKEKQIKVIVSGDEEGTWNVVTSDDEIHEAHKNVYILKDEDGDIEIEKIIEEHGDGENVKVIVITSDEDGDYKVNVGQDADSDQDVDVEVKVIQKKQKEEKK